MQVWIPHLLPCARTDCRRSRLRSVNPSLLAEAQGRKDEMRLTSNSGVSAGLARSYFKDSIRVNERQHFDSLSSSGGKHRSTGSQDKCYLSSWRSRLAWMDWAPKSWKTGCPSPRNDLFFLLYTSRNVCVCPTLIQHMMAHMDRFKVMKLKLSRTMFVGLYFNPKFHFTSLKTQNVECT